MVQKIIERVQRVGRGVIARFEQLLNRLLRIVSPSKRISYPFNIECQWRCAIDFLVQYVWITFDHQCQQLLSKVLFKIAPLSSEVAGESMTALKNLMPTHENGHLCGQVTRVKSVKLYL